jgi:hypothetical protein
MSSLAWQQMFLLREDTIVQGSSLLSAPVIISYKVSLSIVYAITFL